MHFKSRGIVEGKMDWVEQELPYGSLIFDLVRRIRSGNFVEDLCTTLDGI